MASIFVLLLIRSSLGAVSMFAIKEPTITLNLDGGADQQQFLVAIAAAGAKQPQTGRPLDMVGANGTRYRCWLPTEENALSRDDPTSAESKGAAGASKKSPEELLDSMGDWCAYRVDEWWTYEVCYKKGARQYHVEPMGKVTEQYHLGNYSAADSALDEIIVDESATASPSKKFVRAHYTNGAECELAGERRTVELRLVCGTSGQTLLLEVREPRSCSYVFTVATPRLCKHPEFQETAAPATPIPCYQIEHEGAAEGEDGVAETCSHEGTCSAGGMEGDAILPLGDGSTEGGADADAAVAQDPL